MKTARVFLSHASPDKPLVCEVAAVLARRGIISWLDVQELRIGDDLSRALTRAVETQSVLALFLSEIALDRPWVHDELAVALAMEDQARVAGAPHQPVMPVFLGEPLSLVKRHPLLRSRWLHPDGDRLDRLGFRVSSDDAPVIQARNIADNLTNGVYKLLELPRASDVALVLDQRGKGARDGTIPGLPTSLETSDIPALVFRPGLGPRTEHEVIQGEAWTELMSDLDQSLGRALGTRRPVPPKIRILGNSQLALAYALGARINRTSGAKLYGYGRDGLPLSLDLGGFDTALASGDAACARPGTELLTATPESRGLRPSSLVLLLMHNERYMRQAVAAVRARDASAPIAWIPHPPRIDDAAQIITLARDIKAFVDHVHGSHVELATSLPFHALPLLGALLTPHVFDSVTFLEYVRGDHDRLRDYVPLRIP
jgi:hypothetical protein